MIILYVHQGMKILEKCIKHFKYVFSRIIILISIVTHTFCPLKNLNSNTTLFTQNWMSKYINLFVDLKIYTNFLSKCIFQRCKYVWYPSTGGLVESSGTIDMQIMYFTYSFYICLNVSKTVCHLKYYENLISLHYKFEFKYLCTV